MKVFFPTTMFPRYLAVFSSLDDAMEDAKKQSLVLLKPVHIIAIDDLFFVDTDFILLKKNRLNIVYENGEIVDHGLN